MRILALVPGGISEQLLFFPTLDDIKRAYPEAEVSVVVEPRSTAAYRVCKQVNSVIPFDYESRNSPSDWANLLGIMRDREYEVVFLTQPRWSESLLLWLSGIPTRITYSTTGTPWLYTATVPYHPDQYQAALYHDLLQGIGVKSTCPELSVNLPKADLDWAAQKREKLGLQKGYVLMYPGPAAPLNADPDPYPVASWQTLIQDFQSKQPQLPVVLLQTADSRSAIGELSASQGSLKIAGPGNIGQTAAMVAGADLVITPDCYVMQLAIALNVFTLAMLGASEPSRVLPKPAQDDPRAVGIQSASSRLADLKPEAVLEKVWGG